jgi:hypothetical protein
MLMLGRRRINCGDMFAKEMDHGKVVEMWRLLHKSHGNYLAQDLITLAMMAYSVRLIVVRYFCTQRFTTDMLPLCARTVVSYGCPCAESSLKISREELTHTPFAHLRTRQSGMEREIDLKVLGGPRLYATRLTASDFDRHFGQQRTWYLRSWDNSRCSCRVKQDLLADSLRNVR